LTAFSKVVLRIELPAQLTRRHLANIRADSWSVAVTLASVEKRDPRYQAEDTTEIYQYDGYHRRAIPLPDERLSRPTGKINLRD